MSTGEVKHIGRLERTPEWIVDMLVLSLSPHQPHGGEYDQVSCYLPILSREVSSPHQLTNLPALVSKRISLANAAHTLPIYHPSPREKEGRKKLTRRHHRPKHVQPKIIHPIIERLRPVIRHAGVPLHKVAGPKIQRHTIQVANGDNGLDHVPCAGEGGEDNELGGEEGEGGPYVLFIPVSAVEQW